METTTNKVDKTEVKAQIADLSRLLGMIPGDDTVTVQEPMTEKSMALSGWFDESRKSFLKLSILLDKALDLNFQ